MPDVEISVEYYDQEQKNLIAANQALDFAEIDKLAGTVVRIPEADFFTYGMFRFQKERRSGYDTFADLAALRSEYKIHQRYLELRSNGSLVKTQGPRIDLVEIPEFIGVAGSLSLASKVYELTQADWVKIPISNQRKTFDFSHQSSIPGRFLRIESKGSIVEDNLLKNSSVSKHKRSIFEKKEESLANGSLSRARDACIGMITVADQTNRLRTWIVDPESDSPDTDPEKIGLLSRLFYYLSLVRTISPRSQLAIALANRLTVLQVLASLDGLDGLALTNASLEDLYISEAFLNNKSIVRQVGAVGKLLRQADSLIFVGVDEDIFRMLIKQNFAEIRSFKSRSREVEARFLGKMSAEERAFVVGGFAVENLRQQNRRIEFQLSMRILKNSAGFCYGILDAAKT